MHQAVNARLKLHESTERGDADHLARDHSAGRILFRSHIPGLGLKLLQAKLDPLALRVQAENLDIHFLIGRNNLGRMLDMSPAQVGHMNQAIHAAQIHKRTEVGQTAHDAVHDLALLQAGPGFGLLCGRFLAHHGAAAGHNTALLLVHLNDFELEGLAHEVADFLDVAVGELRRRHERTNAVDRADQAALDDFLAHTLDILVVFVLLDKLREGLAVQDVALRQQNVAFAVVYLDDLHFDFVAQFDILRHQVFALDQPVALETDVDTDFIVGDLHHGALHGLPGPDLDQSRFHISHKAVLFRLLGGNLPVQLFLVSHACDNLLK